MSDAERALREAEESRLRTKEKQLADLYRSDGLRESRSKIEAEAATIEAAIAKEEEALRQVEGAKRAYEEAAGDRFAKRINPFLPDGEAVVEFDEKGGARLFWKRGDAKTPARSLSGGERAVFLPALAAAWANEEGAAIVAMEGGEVDSAWLSKTVGSMVEDRPENVQFFVLSWHLPDKTVTDPRIQYVLLGEDDGRLE